MRTFVFFVAVVLLTGTCYAQQVYQIRADSVRIYNVCDTAELIIENRTRSTQGFLYNKGAGRTEFRKLRLEKIGSSRIAISGQDTLELPALSGNYIKNDTALQSASFQIAGQGTISNDYTFSNEAYHTGNLELRSANNPGVGFHRHNGFGWALYSDSALSLRGRNNDGRDVVFWHTGNAPRPMIQHYYRLHAADGTSADRFEQGATFCYAAGAPFTGPLLSFGGLNGGYDCQISADYYYGNAIAFRVRNGDTVKNAWNTWLRLIHEGDVATKGSSIVLKTEANGYLGVESWVRVAPGTGIYTSAGSHFYSRNAQTWAVRPEPNSTYVWLEFQNTKGYSLGGLHADTLGNIGIVNPMAANYRLRTDAAGNAYVTGQVQATAFIQTSLRSLKKDIQPLPYAALPVLMKAQVRSFKFKADSTGKTNIGFIADEVPDEMSIPDRNGVDQANTVGLLVKSAQELNAEQTDLKQQVKALQEQVRRLEALVQQLMQSKS